MRESRDGSANDDGVQNARWGRLWTETKKDSFVHKEIRIVGTQSVITLSDHYFLISVQET